MEINDLHYFTAAADAGSFSSAGKALGRNPSTLSRHANHNQTSYGYDSRNRVTSRTDGLLVSESYHYDANSNMTGHTDRTGNVTAYQYDQLDRRKVAGFGFNGTSYQSTINYGWDAGNRLTQAVDSIAGTIARGYDGLDRLASETTPQGAVAYPKSRNSLSSARCAAFERTKTTLK